MDEPQLKATFSLTLISKKDYVNISNMPVHSEKTFLHPDPSLEAEKDALFKQLGTEEERESTEKGEAIEWKETTFEKTPPVRSPTRLIDRRLILSE